MRIVATACAKDEADVITESVQRTLAWVDEFVIYDNGSTDGTPDLAEKAGAMVIRGQPEPWNEGLRQHCLNVLPDLHPDVVMRIDIDEMYDPQRGLGLAMTADKLRPGSAPLHPRDVIEWAFGNGSTFCMPAVQAEFWITLDDVARGVLVEDMSKSVWERRRFYTIGHTAMVAWRYYPSLRYYMDVDFQRRRNVPVDELGRDVRQLGPCVGPLGPHGEVLLLQRHYTGNNLLNLARRILDRRRDLNTYGKARYNLIIDERYGLHYLGDDDVFDFRFNHDVIGKWYKDSLDLSRVRRSMGFSYFGK